MARLLCPHIEDPLDCSDASCREMAQRAQEAARTPQAKGLFRKGAKAAADPYRPRRTAEYDSDCPVCDERIYRHDPIVLDEDEQWVHDPECL